MANQVVDTLEWDPVHTMILYAQVCILCFHVLIGIVGWFASWVHFVGSSNNCFKERIPRAVLIGPYYRGQYVRMARVHVYISI